MCIRDRLNAAPGMAEDISERLSRKYGHQFDVKTNKFFGLANHSGLNVVHGALKALAADMFKIAQDIRFLGSGPRAGLGELNLPANEPGSSIMPGKVNPTQAEDGIRDSVASRGLGDVYKRQRHSRGHLAAPAAGGS